MFLGLIKNDRRDQDLMGGEVQPDIASRYTWNSNKISNIYSPFAGVSCVNSRVFSGSSVCGLLFWVYLANEQLLV